MGSGSSPTAATSNYEGVNIEAARNRSGQALARRDTFEVDCVAGISDSGIGHAIGHAAESRIPFRRPFVKYTPTWSRSFTTQEQRVRDLVAWMKLIPIRDLIDGERIPFCEASIVRGTQLGDIIERVFDHGAREATLKYQTLSGMAWAIGLSCEKLCAYCWNGQSKLEASSR